MGLLMENLKYLKSISNTYRIAASISVYKNHLSIILVGLQFITKLRSAIETVLKVDFRPFGKISKIYKPPHLSC